jgi:small multidrug resistance pump
MASRQAGHEVGHGHPPPGHDACERDTVHGSSIPFAASECRRATARWSREGTGVLKEFLNSSKTSRFDGGARRGERAPRSIDDSGCDAREILASLKDDNARCAASWSCHEGPTCMHAAFLAPHPGVITMSRALLFLYGAIVFEVLWAVMLKLARGPTLSAPTFVMAVAYVLSLSCLSVACRQLDLSFAYAVWTGSGATLVALIGVLAFGERLNAARAIGFVLVICGLVVLLGFERRTT